MNFDIFLTLYHSKVNIINCLKGILTICFLILCEVSPTWLLEVQKTILFELILVWANQSFICEDQTWLDVLKMCYTTSKLQWSNPKHTFCLWKLGEDIHQSIIEFLVFLVKKRFWQPVFDNLCPVAPGSTCPAQFHRSITNRFWQCWGWSNHSWCRGSTATTTTTTTTTTTSSSAKLAPGPARHELTHLRITHPWWCWLGHHARPWNCPASSQWLWLLSWHDSNHLSDRHHLVFLLIQSLLVSLDFFHDMMEWGNPVTWDLLVQISKFFLKTSHWVFPGAKANSPLVFCWKTLLMNWLLNNLGGGEFLEPSS